MSPGPPAPSRLQKWCEMPRVRGPVSGLGLELGHSYSLPCSAEISACLLPEILTCWYFAFVEPYSSQETLCFGSPAGRECAYLHFPRSACMFTIQLPNIACIPMVPACASYFEPSVMPLSTLQALYTSKQTNRDPNTPQQAYCQRISFHAGTARRIQIRIA